MKPVCLGSAHLFYAFCCSFFYTVFMKMECKSNTLNRWFFFRSNMAWPLPRFVFSCVFFFFLGRVIDHRHQRKNGSILLDFFSLWLDIMCVTKYWTISAKGFRCIRCMRPIGHSNSDELSGKKMLRFQYVIKLKWSLPMWTAPLVLSLFHADVLVGTWKKHYLLQT